MYLTQKRTLETNFWRKHIHYIPGIYYIYVEAYVYGGAYREKKKLPKIVHTKQILVDHHLDNQDNLQ